MKAKEIFKQLSDARNEKVNGGMTSSQLKEAGVESIEVPHPDTSDDVISHTLFYGDDGGIVEEIITSYDHSRTFELRPDPNHFHIRLLGQEDSFDSMIMDDM